MSGETTALFGHAGNCTREEQVEKILNDVKTRGIELVRFLYTDNDAVVRCHASTPEALEGDLRHGMSFAIAMPFFSALDQLVPGTRYGGVGAVRALPDPQTYRVLPYATNTGVVICEFCTKDEHHPNNLCGRTLLREYLSTLQCHVNAAFENEFYLLKKSEDGRYTPADNGLCFATSTMNSFDAIALDIVRALGEQGVSVVKCHSEYGAGQFEVAYRHDDALRTADNQVLVRETIRGVAHKHRLVASFMPKIDAHWPGSGAHLHLSLLGAGENLLHDPNDPYGLSQTGRHFIGGILKHMKALCAFTAATVNSYKRLTPHSWASAYSCYGFDNREAAVRVIRGPNGGSESSLHLEIKPIDGTANPYLALMATIAAGMDGTKNRIDPGKPVFVDPHDMTAAQRREENISRLPKTLFEAIAALEEDDLFKEVMGEDFVCEYVKLKRLHWDEYVRSVSDWEIKSYVETF